jgi:hypothetical protein
MKKTTLILFLFTCGALFAQNQLLSSVDESFDSSISAWGISSGNDYTYDVNGNHIETTFYFYDSNTSTYTPSDKEVYLYNANNRLIQDLYRDYNSTTQQFEDEYRSFYTYNSNSQVTGSVGEEFINGAWINDYRFTLNYSSNRVSSFVSQNWNGVQWINDELFNISYNSNNQVTSILYSEWISNQWEVYGRDTNTLDSNGRVITKTYETGDGTNWSVEETYSYTYDSNGNKISQVDLYTGGGFKEEYSHDTNILMANLDHPFKDKTGLDFLFEENPNINKLLSKNEFEYDNSTMTFSSSPNYRTIYNYNSILATDEEAIDITSFKIFPNPTTNLITIEAANATINKINLYDVLGKIVLSTSEDSFEIGQLVDGVYILKIEDNLGNITNRKVIKN